jgi:hypothetical protein
MELTKTKEGWKAVSVHTVNGEELRLTTCAHGGTPKSNCERKHTEGAFKDRWIGEYPHLFGYMLGFGVKADKRTIRLAHEAAIEAFERQATRTEVEFYP